MRIADLELDPVLRRATRADHELALSMREFDFLFALMQQAGEMLTQHQLLQAAWPQAKMVTINIVGCLHETFVGKTSPSRAT